MRHLRKFNESMTDLSFEMFKDIMQDLVDEFPSEVKFQDFSNEEEDPFYDFWIELPNLEAEFVVEANPFGFDYLDYPDFESPEEMPQEWSEQIGNHIHFLKRLQVEAENAVSVHEMFYEMIGVLKNDVIPKLESFSNCNGVTVGTSIDHLRICFEMK